MNEQLQRATEFEILNSRLRHAGEFILKDVDPSKRTITGMITTDAVDRYGEVVDPNGAMLKDYRNNPVVLLNHMSWGLPIGKNVWIKPEKNGLLAQTQFADTGEGNDVFQLYDSGFMKAWSIGFAPKEWVEGKAEDGFRRKFLKWVLLEYSAVTVPANPEALTNALDRCESLRVREELEARNTQLKQTEQLEHLHSLLEGRDNSIAELREQINILDARFERFLIGGEDDENDSETDLGAGSETEEKQSDTPDNQTKTTTQVEVPTIDEAKVGKLIDAQIAEVLAERGLK